MLLEEVAPKNYGRILVQKNKKNNFMKTSEFPQQTPRRMAKVKITLKSEKNALLR